MSLRLRIILTYVLLVAASFSCLIYLIINDVRPRYLEAVEEPIVDFAELLAALLAEQSSGDAVSLGNIDEAMAALAQRKFSAQIYNIHKQNVDLRIYVTDAKGILLYDSSGEARPGADFSQWRDVLLTLQGRYGARSTETDPSDPASRVIYVAAPIVKDGKTIGVVSVGKPTNSVYFLIAIAQKRFLLSLLLVGGTAAVLAVVLSAWITRPVRKLTAHMRAVEQGRPQKLPDLGAAEIRDLGVALEDMRARLEGKSYIEDYVRGLTHELKSPLTGIKGAAEILRDQISDPQGVRFLDNIDVEAERMQSLVERMLQLSRLENVKTVSRAKIVGRAFFHDLAEAFHTRLVKKNLRLNMNIAEGLTLKGDELLLHQAFSNLLANAVDFSPAGAAISVDASMAGEDAVIAVKDQGPGMPDFALPKAFDKFFSLPRPDSGQKSSGLGLPFVKAVVVLHGGKVELRNCNVGANTGLEVVVTLPEGG